MFLFSSVVFRNAVRFVFGWKQSEILFFISPHASSNLRSTPGSIIHTVVDAAGVKINFTGFKLYVYYNKNG